MKVAIHHKKGSFSDGWIQYCIDNEINYSVVNAYDNNIIDQLKEFDVFLWHHSHGNYRDKLFAKSLITSLENIGVKVFPNINTCWHFDDKVAQKYLFESIKAPLVPSYVFYDKQTALDWAKQTTYPKVFKLRGGAGSSNVRLVHSYSECTKIIKKAFRKGFNPTPHLHLAYDQFKLWIRGKARFYDIAKYIGLFFLPSKYMSKMLPMEKGYVYFQEFIPENKYDTRVIVIGEKAYGMHRMVRKGDFRASGSSTYDYSPIRRDVLKIAFDTAKKLKLQSAAFDFIYTEADEPLIVEVSYGFGTKGSGQCTGYWNVDLNYIESNMEPEKWIIQELLS